MLTNAPVRTTFLSAVMDDAFMLVLSQWTMARLVDFLREARYSHIIILRQEGTTRYRYLYSRNEVKDVITHSNPMTTVRDAFGLHEYKATSEAQADIDAGSVTFDRAIVMGGGSRRRLHRRPCAARRVCSYPRWCSGAEQTAFTAFPALTAPDGVAPDQYLRHLRRLSR